ncbi:(2Fe-2S)-binding protein [Arsenicicoccus piscis]|uniref:Ferric siderophore reductase C-terminal domain-containing protein n=1 Tax=Arsenicicoccus piscis TaxID=673954 RepID=A0ABQ6HTM8_9MICO|nr:(2Fe-2S)-binding protein [Arsenicicoccus piscis]MCH8626319.1 (2Fe-2S)-binding protein [Arsenicicoccus piscis]GMA20925.1 hypothetical protein GCM10025862_29460 [Arsenicicoccus piscis]
MTPPTVDHPARAEALERELEGLGPFIAARILPHGTTPGSGWEAMSVLVDPGRVAARVEAVGAAMTATAPAGITISRRVAASVAHLGLIARILAPVMALRALGTPADPDLDTLWWRNELDGPPPLAITTANVPPNLDDDPSCTAVPRAVVVVTGAFVTHAGMSPRVAWGNVASSANSVMRVIATARPDLAAAATAAADEVLTDPRLEGGALHSGPGFRRRSCCLIYQAASTRDAICGDCVLTTC